jgi:hypothetical protein
MKIVIIQLRFRCSPDQTERLFLLPALKTDLERAAYRADNGANDERNTVQHIAVNLAYAEPCPDQ